MSEPPILDQMADLHRQSLEAHKVAQAAASKLHWAIWRTLEEGHVPATTIADRLGVSRGRVYQWARKGRDEWHRNMDAQHGQEGEDR